jgi:hypothetical protein
MVTFINSQYMTPLCLISTLRHRLLKNGATSGELLKLTVGNVSIFVAN